MLGVVGGKRHKGRQNKRWIETIKEDSDLVLRQLNNMVYNRNKWRSLADWITENQFRLNG